MPEQREPQDQLQPALLDRLTDEEPDKKLEPRLQRVITKKKLREAVLRGSLRVYPGLPGTNVHLGRILLFRKDWLKAKVAYMEALSTNPFDPEVHIALTKIHHELGETALKERTVKAAALLTGMSEPAVENTAWKFMRDPKELSGANVSEPQADTPDAGTPKDGGK